MYLHCMLDVVAINVCVAIYIQCTRGSALYMHAHVHVHCVFIVLIKSLMVQYSVCAEFGQQFRIPWPKHYIL